MSNVISDEESLKNIAVNVTRLRADTALSLSELARMCTVKDDVIYPSAIQRIERGENMPGAGLLSRLAEALGTTVDSLLSAPPKKISRGA